MSTYYYMICDNHKERTDAASRTFGGHCSLADGSETLLPFIISHSECNVRIASEHNEDSYSDEFRDWEKGLVVEEINKAKADGRW